MWSLLKSLLLKWAALKALLRILASLGWLLPIALLLKSIGVPLLILLAVLAIPLFIVLAIFGLPLLLIVVIGGGLLMFTMWIASMGLLALKIALPIIAIYWVIRWLTRKREDSPPSTPTAGEEGGAA
ncbi:MAG: hypothetical protein ACT4P7_20790 [Gemmatimonadaceae bacterium]